MAKLKFLLYETRNIPLCSLHPNTGRIDGVPKNPRFIRDEKFAKLRKSIEDDSEMLELRELGVYESRPGYYVVLLGNMRLRAMKDLGYKEAPCKIIPQGTDAKKLRAYTVKDNVSCGDNDWDIMANELLPIEFQQLEMRTTTLTIIDYNPSFDDEHWICQLNREQKTYHFISTYKDNPFLEQTIIDEIESLQFKNQNTDVQPMGIDAILALPTAKEVITALQEKTINVPLWTGKYGLKAQYDPTLHPVMDKGKYPDGMDEDGHPEPVTRITYDLQRLAVKRMTELITGIPPKRIYKSRNDRQKKVAEYLEAIYQRTRIESVNVERLNMLYAGCEVITLWYAVEQKNNLYGFDSELKLRVRNFSPMLGDDLYPLFDEYGDLIALSVGYKRKVAKKDLFFFDTYTAEKHLKWWSENNNEWTLAEDEDITIGQDTAADKG